VKKKTISSTITTTTTTPTIITTTTTTTSNEGNEISGNNTTEENVSSSPPPITSPKINFSYVECLLYVFHQFAFKAPKLCYQLCGIYPTANSENSGQPTEPLSPLSEEITTEKDEFIKRLTSLEENYKVIDKFFKKLSANILTRAKAAPATDKKTLAEKRSSVQIALRTVTNIQKLVASLKAKSPHFLSDTKDISLSWTSPPSGLGKDDTNDEKTNPRRLIGRGFQRNGVEEKQKGRVKVLLAGRIKKEKELKAKQMASVKKETNETNETKEEETTEPPPKRIRTEKKSKRTIYLPPTKRSSSQQIERIEITSDPIENKVKTDIPPRPQKQSRIIRQLPPNPKKRKGRGEFRKIMH